MLSVRDLRKDYGDLKALQGVSFEVQEGDILGFLGPNGAGKSTTMRIITGYIPATSGEVEVDGFDVQAEPLEVRRRIGYLPEHTPLYQEMRVEEFLRYRAHIKGVPRRERSARVDEVMGMAFIRDRRRQIIRNLSKGYRQRVGIADALIGRPRLLILDEPTIGLDPNQVRQVRDLIKSLAEERTVILSTHILPEVEMICNKVVIISEGTTVASASIEGLVEEFDDNALLLRFAGDGALDEVPAALARLEGARSVVEQPAEGGERAWRITAAPDIDLRTAAFALASDRSWPLLELHRERVGLESVFARLTGGADQAPPAETEASREPPATEAPATAAEEAPPAPEAVAETAKDQGAAEAPAASQEADDQKADVQEAADQEADEKDREEAS